MARLFSFLYFFIFYFLLGEVTREESKHGRTGKLVGLVGVSDMKFTHTHTPINYRGKKIERQGYGSSVAS